VRRHPRGKLNRDAATPPPPQPDPSATGTDIPPPGGEETSQTLSAPDPPEAGPRVEVGAQDRPPGTTDGRPLAQQVYDQRNPLSEYDLPTILLNQNVPPDQVDDTIRAIIHNEPPPGQPHPRFGLDDADPPSTVADPVILFSGAYTLTATDVQIPSRGFPLELTRMYRSGTVHFGPWGYNWDHNYNAFLRELDDGGAAVWTGGLTEDVYRLNPDGTFEPPLGVLHRLERIAATPLNPDRWVVSDQAGMQQVFERPPAWPLSDRIPMVSVEDRHGNAHTLGYDAEGRLQTVSDHAGRFLEFLYGDCGLLEVVRDHAGRRWRYMHGADIEHLEAVVSPPTSDYPDGLATYYEYDRHQDHPALRHNLTRVLDPTGRQILENRYGDDPGTDDFGRVIYQEFGGFQASFTATRLQYVPRVPDAINVPDTRVEVLECGTLQVYTFNYRGDLLDHRFRLVRDGSYRLVARLYRYDDHGNCTEAREPNGLGVLTEFDTTNADPRGRGNPLRIVLSAPLTKPAPGRDIARYTYEPRYQRVKTARDGRGAVTTYVYDYEVSPRDRGDIVRIEHPDVTLPDGTLQSAAETFTYNAVGQLVERRSGEGHRFTYDYYAAGPADGYLERTTAGAGVEDQTQEFSYDSFGMLSGVSDATGATTEYERNALGQVVRLRKPAVGGATGDVVYRYGPDGRLRTLDTPRGGYQDATIADPFIRHEFQFDVLGHVRSAVYGANTAQPRRWTFKRASDGQPLEIVDPLGRVTRTVYDERRLPLRHTLFPGTPDERTAHLVYDRNGRLTRFTDATGRRVDHAYDSWDRLQQMELPGAASQRTTIRYTYGDRDELESSVTRGVGRPGGPVVVLEDWSQHFDERGRPATRVQGAVTEERWHDRDDCLVRIVDQRGNATLFTCDALRRPTQITDATGNRRLHTYDNTGDLIRVEEIEVGPGGAASGLYTSSLAYDERGRLRLVTDPLGNVTLAEYDDRDLLAAVVSPGGMRTEFAYDIEGQLTNSRGIAGGLTAEHAWQRDAGGRVLTYTDPEGSQTRYEYELEDRWTAITTPGAPRRERRFDVAGQLERERAPSGAETRFFYGLDGSVDRISYTPGPGMLAVPDLLYGRDGAGRVVELSQGTDSLELTYDALGRLTSETRAGATVSWSVDDAAGFADLSYPDGRVDRYTIDALGRFASIHLLSLGTPPATGPSLGPGSALATYEYDGQTRIARRTAGNGSVTYYRYDRGRRLAGIDHRDGAGIVLARTDYVHDAASARRFAGSDPPPGTPALADIDGLLRLTGMVEGFAAPAPPANATQADADAYLTALGMPAGSVDYEFTVDRADVRTRTVTTEAGVQSTDDYTTDQAHQITALTRTTPVGSSVFTYDFDSDGRCVADHRHRYVYDAMGRLREVMDLTGTSLLTQDYDPAGRVSERSLTGGAAQTLRYFGFRAVQAETGAVPAVLQRCFGAHPDELILESGGTDRWVHQDGRLSLLALTDAGGTVVERYSYAPFGAERIWAPDGVTRRAASSVDMAPIYGGHRLTGVPSLYDARARVYDAETGRFLQRDPRGYASGPNPYAYVAHNPVDWMDPTGEILPIIGIIIIIGALAGAGYSIYDAVHHPEKYEGPLVFRAALNTFAGAAIAGVSALGGEAVLASVGLGTFAGGAAGGATLAGAGTAGTLTIGQTFVLSGTVSATGGFIWRGGFNGLFPEYVEPPSAGTITTDYALGGALGVGFRVVEAVGNPFSRTGWNTVRTTTAEAALRARIWANRVTGNFSRAEQLGRDIAEIRVGRLHASELQEVGRELESLAFRIPGEGQRVVFGPEIDAVTDSAWIQVKASGVPGRAARIDLAQAQYTAAGSPTGRSIFYVEPRPGYPVPPAIVRDLRAVGVTEVHPLTPALRGTEPFPLPFQGLLGLPAARVPWAVLPWAAPSGGGRQANK
jgi:RHS repeat-associated protein